MKPPVNLPAAPGTYLLIMRLDVPRRVMAGRLGAFELNAGLYAYVGSARGPGGLHGRVGRHLRESSKRAHWHIDALAAVAPIVEVWIVESRAHLECAWAGGVAGAPGVEKPISGFGASDCGCRTHLFALPSAGLDAVWEALGRPVRLRITVE